MTSPCIKVSGLVPAGFPPSGQFALIWRSPSTTGASVFTFPWGRTCEVLAVMSRLIRHSLISILVLILLALVSLIAVYQLLATESGSRWLTAKLMDRTEAKISYHRFSGTFQSGIT